ncbi:MAG TPA: Gfo/Idh/MocA family oxidoreductase [Thermomicrobiales bacterium]|nr:Gfo/Idh/MocA family oxidoreductase [Thermomicrobiales bacterium]
MVTRDTLRVGLVGCGFMGRTHSNAWRQAERFFPDLPVRPVLQAVCARNPDEVGRFASQWGFASTETDWRALVARDDIDLIDIASPNDTHAEIAVAAAEAGKLVSSEKPLGRTVAEAERMVEAVEAAGVANMVWYNYRRVPAVTLAKQLVDEGRLGRVFHYRAKFLQDWTISADVPQGGPATWRLDVDVAGSGVTGDLLAHCIDTAIWLNGPIGRVSAMTETFVKERPDALTGEVRPVGIDDASAFLARFENGALGTFEATRYARGHKALYTLEINGEHASIAWDLHDLHRLEFFDHRDEGRLRGWRSIHVTDGDHPYMKRWWVPGLQIGYEHTFVHQAADFLTSLRGGEPFHPTFREALATDRVTGAVLASAKSERWETVAP